MVKKLFLLLTAVVFLTGCEKKDAFDMVCPTVYVSDKGDLAYITDSLVAAGIDRERALILEEHINQFNSSVNSSDYAGVFEERNLLEVPYDPYVLQDQWMEKSPGFDGYNCRITSFSLFSQFLEIPVSAKIRDNELFMDRDSLEADGSALINSDLDSFLRFYSTVPTENTKNVKKHAAILEKSFKDRGISFNPPESVSDITVWFHNQWSEEENELFCGHTGILVDTGNELLFIEKIAFMEPYKATKFNSAEELKSYLLAKYDVDYGQKTASPFVMINDKLL